MWRGLGFCSVAGSMMAVDRERSPAVAAGMD